MCLVRPALLYFNVHVLKVFYEQINYYYYNIVNSLLVRKHNRICLSIVGLSTLKSLV